MKKIILTLGLALIGFGMLSCEKQTFKPNTIQDINADSSTLVLNTGIVFQDNPESVEKIISINWYDTTELVNKEIRDTLTNQENSFQTKIPRGYDYIINVNSKSNSKHRLSTFVYVDGDYKMHQTTSGFLFENNQVLNLYKFYY